MGLAELLAQKKAASTNPALGISGAQATPGVAPALPNLAVPPKPAVQSRMKMALQSLSKVKTGSQRNRLPLGTGWFLLKHGSYRVTEQKQRKITVFSLYCLKGIQDGQNLYPSAPSYSGPKAGELYEVALFQEGDYMDSMMSRNLQAVQACMGWTPEYVEQLKKYLESGPAETDPTVVELNAIFGNTIGVDLNGTPSGQPCMFSNQIVLKLKTASTTKEQKTKDGQPVFNAQGQKLTTTYINTYWQKRISLEKVVAEVPEADILKAFGSPEAFVAAYEAEKAFNLPA